MSENKSIQENLEDQKSKTYVEESGSSNDSKVESSALSLAETSQEIHLEVENHEPHLGSEVKIIMKRDSSGSVKITSEEDSDDEIRELLMEDVDQLDSRLQDNRKISEHEHSKVIFSALGLSSGIEEVDENIRIVDEVDSLVLLHYVKISRGIQHVRGIIVDFETGDVVCQSFPFTKEYTPTDERLRYYDFRKALYTLAYEGTILRVYYDCSASKWRISTHRKINASESRWAGDSFEENFKKLWGDRSFDDILDKNYCYSFLLSDPGNRIVCHIDKLSLYHVGTFPKPKRGEELNYNNQMYLNGKFNSKLSVTSETITLPEILETNKESICKRLCEENFEFVKKATGVLVHLSCGTVIKLVPPCYVYFRWLRGNDPSYEKRLTYLWKRDLTLRYQEKERAKYNKGKSRTIEANDSENFLKFFSERTHLLETKRLLEEVYPEHLKELFSYRFAVGNYLRLSKTTFLFLKRVQKFYKEELTLLENIFFQLSKLKMSLFFSLIRECRDRMEGDNHQDYNPKPKYIKNSKHRGHGKEYERERGRSRERGSKKGKYKGW